MELEQLLQLLQAYGVTKYADNEHNLELVHLNRSEVYSDEEDFQIMVEDLKIEPN